MTLLPKSVSGIKKTSVIIAVAGLLAVAVLVLPIALILILARMEAEKELAAMLAETKTAGYAVTAEELALRYDTVPADGNAAPLYLRAAALIAFPSRMDAFPHFWDQVFWPRRGQAWPAGWKLSIEELLDTNGEVIALLHEAATYPSARYPPDFPSGIETPFPHDSPLAECARLLGLVFAWHAETGDWKEAVDALIALFAIADSLRNETSFINQSARISILFIGVETLERALARVGFSADFLV